MSFDSPADDFDEEEWASTPMPVRDVPRQPDVPSVLLRAEQVAAVRFHTAKPGYAFAQVETFVEQVQQTLAYLEQVVYQRDLALHESREERADLEDRIATLAATIEVFRAKGDPVVGADGAYVTASSAGDPAREQALTSQIESLTASLADAHAQVSSLTASLAASERARVAAEEGEAEIRGYVDNVLGPWLAAASAAQTVQVVQAAPVPAPVVVPEPAPEPVVVPEPAPEPVVVPEPAPAPVVVPEPAPEPVVVPEPAPEPVVVPEVEEGDAEPIDLGGDDWADAPSVVLPRLAPEGEPAPDDSDNGDAEQPRLGLLVSAPELGGISLDPSALPAPNQPIPDVPPPPARKRAPLTSAPELAGLDVPSED